MPDAHRHGGGLPYREDVSARAEKGEAAVGALLEHLADSTRLMFKAHLTQFFDYVDARARERVFISVTSMPSDVDLFAKKA